VHAKAQAQPPRRRPDHANIASMASTSLSRAERTDAAPSDSRPPRPGRTARQTALQEAVLAAAGALFAERGFDTVTVAEIAEQVGVSKGAVLYHFHSKEDLWKAAVDRIVRDYESLFPRREIDGEIGFDTLEQMSREFILACVKAPAYFRILALEAAGDTWRARWFGERHLKKHFAFYEGMVRQLQSCGALGDVDPLVLQGVLAGYQTFVGQAPMILAATGRDVTAPAFVESFIQTGLTLLQALRVDRD
jgi:TetR/AcrR family transcriptional regulator